MTSKTTANETVFDQTASLVRDFIEDPLSHGSLCKAITEDFLVRQEHASSSVDTAFKSSEIDDVFPDRLPKPREARYSFAILQEWEGYVVSISKDAFTARLADVTSDSSIEDEEADFSLGDLKDADRKRICPGTIFRWTVGYRRGPGGAKDRSSRIVFRNLPAWTQKDLEKSHREAAQWASELNDG